MEDVVQQTRRLQNKMFVMSGKIQGKPLLPLPEHLVRWDDSGAALDWWVLLAPLGVRKPWQGPRRAQMAQGGMGAGTLHCTALGTAIPCSRQSLRGSCQASAPAEMATSRRDRLP